MIIVKILGFLSITAFFPAVLQHLVVGTMKVVCVGTVKVKFHSCRDYSGGNRETSFLSCYRNGMDFRVDDEKQ